MDNGQLIIAQSGNPLKDKSYTLALLVIKTVRELQQQKEFVLSKQLLRSGTAVGALVEEANQAESKADFIHKLSIANKEANESQYWIRLMMDSQLIERGHGNELLVKVSEVIKILIASIKTSKANRQRT
jgi:four helix bundle protein